MSTVVSVQIIAIQAARALMAQHPVQTMVAVYQAAMVHGIVPMVVMKTDAGPSYVMMLNLPVLMVNVFRSSAAATASKIAVMEATNPRTHVVCPNVQMASLPAQMVNVLMSNWPATRELIV